MDQKRDDGLLFPLEEGLRGLAPQTPLGRPHLCAKGQLKVRDGILNAGDYDYEPNGVLHGETEALEDTEYLFICDGPVLFFDDNGPTHYLSWEELVRMRDAAAASPDQGRKP